jgi:hypothetical protein
MNVNCGDRSLQVGFPSPILIAHGSLPDSESFGQAEQDFLIAEEPVQITPLQSLLFNNFPMLATIRIEKRDAVQMLG